MIEPYNFKSDSFFSYSNFFRISDAKNFRSESRLPNLINLRPAQIIQRSTEHVLRTMSSHNTHTSTKGVIIHVPNHQ